MSIHLDLKLSADWNAKAAQDDLVTVDESALRYDEFLGDLILEVNDDFSARWGWIPLLDCAYGLKDMSDEMLVGETDVAFEFTVSDAWLRFSCRGDAVEICASYIPRKTVIEMRDLSRLLTSSAQEFLARIASLSSGLASNSSFRRMRERFLRRIRRDKRSDSSRRGRCWPGGSAHGQKPRLRQRRELRRVA